MINQRAAILDHVFGLLGSVDGVVGVFRNRGELPPNDKTPGIILLDGVTERRTQLDGMNFTSMPPAVFTLKPEIVLAMTPRDTVDNDTLNGVSAPVDVEIAAFEAKILSAILNDESLVAMVSDNGGIVYNGFDSDMRNGSSIGSTGAVTIFKFEFSYVLDPSDLSP